MKKKKNLKFCFEVHSFKHLYNNYCISDLIVYYCYLERISFNIFGYFKSISFSDKFCLVRCILDLEKLIIFNVLGEDSL